MTEALGLAGWKHLSLEILEQVGLRIVAAETSSKFGNPIGATVSAKQAIRPIFQAWTDAAVDTVFLRASPEAMAAMPDRGSDAKQRAAMLRLSAEGLACTKAVCTLRPLPRCHDAMHLMWAKQAHHIGPNYDRFFEPDAYGSTHAAHVPSWHR